MRQVIDGKRYDTETATLICSDHYWDGHNWRRQARNTFLYKTPRGAWFFHHESDWAEEANTLATCTEDEAREFFEAMQPHDTCEVSYEEAFGEPEDA